MTPPREPWAGGGIYDDQRSFTANSILHSLLITFWWSPRWSRWSCWRWGWPAGQLGNLVKFLNWLNVKNMNILSSVNHLTPWPLSLTLSHKFQANLEQIHLGWLGNYCPLLLDLTQDRILNWSELKSLLMKTLLFSTNCVERLYWKFQDLPKYFCLKLSFFINHFLWMTCSSCQL